MTLCPDFDNMALQTATLCPEFDYIVLQVNDFVFRMRRHTPTWCYGPAPGTTAASTPARNSITHIFIDSNNG